MMWRVIGLGAHDAYFNMAADEAIGNGVINGSADPTIRFYTWEPSAVSIGHFQSMVDEVDIEKCKALGVDFVRRKTGGGAVYHDSEGEITYSVIAPERLFPKNIIESYGVICRWIIDALSKLGIEAVFAPINDIVVGGKKISGNAQSRHDGIILQHGTILYGINPDRMFSVLKISNEKISDKMINDVKDRVVSVRDLSSASRNDVYSALLESFTKGKEHRMAVLSPAELDEIRRLVDGTYKTDAWNFMR